MAVIIGHASIDERGKASGGAAGDQTGREVCTRGWYAKGWNKVIRAKDAAIAEKIAHAMEQACANNHIGYDQGQRTTLFTLAQKVGWDLSKITKNCETDCSALVSVCVNAAGVSVSKDIYTGNEAAALKNTGKFKVLTESKYLTTDANLKRGDILLKEGSHTAVVLSNGTNVSGDTRTEQNGKLEAAKSRDTSLSGTYRVTASSLNLRSGAGTNKTIITAMPNGTKVQCYGYYTEVSGTKWLLVVYGNHTGYASVKYLKK